ncbi:hypothetical protein, unknown function [Leishmania tarentolae]|uniref:Uncharacterized protein n=1 Tax=Leishmania tarentolae TaxID=5689 RepID=A0A640KH92_LEITA|nr:hypothetical protein, unknown function [Leishmania tarentolae]
MSARPRASSMHTATIKTSSQFSSPAYCRAAGSRRKECLCPRSPDFESYASTRPPSPPDASGTYPFRHQLSSSPAVVVDGLDAPAFSSIHVSAPWSTTAPNTGSSFYAGTSSGGNASVYDHPAWPLQPHSQQLFLAAPAEARYASITHPGQALDMVGGLYNDLSYSHAETPSAMLSINSDYHNSFLYEANGNISVWGGIPAPPVPPCVAVFASGKQDVFWRRACLRVTCVPVTNTSGRHGEVAAEVSRDAQVAARLEEIRDGACNSSYSNSHTSGCTSGERLGGLVWRWLDTLGMTDAVEDVLSPGAGRVLVVWTTDDTYKQDSVGGNSSDDARQSSPTGKPLAKQLGVSDNGREGRDTTVPGALCEVVFDGVRLLLD